MTQPPQPPPYDKLDYLVQAAAWQITALEAIMAQNDDFSAALSRVEAANTKALAGIAKQIQQLADELATDRAPTPAQIARLNAVAAALEEADVRMAADDAPTPPPGGSTTPTAKPSN